MADDNEETSEQGTSAAEQSEFDAHVELFSEYYEGSLAADQQAELKKLIEEDPKYTKAYADFEKTMELLSGMHKMSAPMNFDKKVEDTIRRKSGGRFFGRRAFGDRIPFELLAVIVMILAGFVYWMGRTSGTGSHRLPHDEAPGLKDSDQEVVPKL